MIDTVCPCCAAVLTNQGDLRICPYCGQDCSRNVARLPHTSIHYLSPTLLLVASSAPMLMILTGVEWKYWALLAIIFGAGASWVFVARGLRHEYNDTTAELAGLTGYLKKSNRTTNETDSLALRKPETPRIWRALMAAPRPREIYLPRAVKFLFLMCGAFACVLCFGFPWAYANHRGPFAHQINWHREWAPLLNSFGVGLGTLLMFWGELRSRKLLRDGEVTIGYWNNGGYQFWTQSGQSFRRSARIVSSDDAIFGIGVVPVFYLPHDPARSAALCSVYSRIRVPTEEQSAGMARVSARL